MSEITQINVGGTSYQVKDPTAATTALATTGTNGLMSAADKVKLNGVATGANNYTLPTATNSVLGGVKVGSGLTITNGVLATTGGGGEGTGTGTNVTECIDSFNYYDGSTTYYHDSSQADVTPAELAHMSGYAYRAVNASCAGWAATASRADSATNASYAISAQQAEYALWAGPCYGNVSGAVNAGVDYTVSKAVQYESNINDESNLVTLCPLPSLGPFMVDVMLCWVDSSGNSFSAKYIVSGTDLQIMSVRLVHGDSITTAGSTTPVIETNTPFQLSSAKLQLNRQNVITGVYAITTTATVCGRLGGDNPSGCSVYYSSCS